MKYDYAYTKYNRVIEFPNNSKEYIKFLALRAFAFAIDYLIVLTLQLLLYNFTSFEWWMVGLAGLAWMIAYASLMFMVFGRTLGLIATRLYATHHTGFLTSNRDLFFRGLLMSIYTFPVVGWALMGTTALTTPFWKGITLVDFISRTTVMTRLAFYDFKEAEQQAEQDTLIFREVNYE